MRNIFGDEFIAFCLGVLFGGFIIGGTMTALCFYYLVDMRM